MGKVKCARYLQSIADSHFLSAPTTKVEFGHSLLIKAVLQHRAAFKMTSGAQQSTHASAEGAAGL